MTKGRREREEKASMMTHDEERIGKMGNKR